MENEAPDLLTKDIEHLQNSIDLYNKLVKINHILIYDNIIEEKQVVKRLAIKIELKSTNKIINELFTIAYKDADLISDLSELLI